MPLIDVIDSTWIPSPPEAVAAEVSDPRRWAQWWPGLALRVQEDRGDRGLRWLVPRGSGGAATGLAGSAEVWLQPMFDGVVAHFFLRLDPVDGATFRRRRTARVERFYRRRTKQAFWELADRADPQRMHRAAPLVSAPRAAADASTRAAPPGAGAASEQPAGSARRPGVTRETGSL